MTQTIYCNCFYCEHYEDGKCLAPILHLGNNCSCKEFTPSQEKLNAHFEAQANLLNKPTEYDEYAPSNISIRIRQK